jgi:signal peptidase I
VPATSGQRVLELPQTKERTGSFRQVPILVLIALVIALLIKTFLVQAFYIPSASMEPTLDGPGDRVLVEKVSYRFHPVSREDVVVFEKDPAQQVTPSPDLPLLTRIGNALKALLGFPTGGREDLIKRVMAVGGDRIEGHDGRVFDNGHKVAEPYLTPGVTTSDFGPVTVPRGELFVMGDNREHSGDSRSFGPISAGKVIGRAFTVIWPPEHFSGL